MSVRDDLQKLLDEKADQTKASATVDGLESKEDYSKLDGVEAEATCDVVEESLADTDNLLSNKAITLKLDSLDDLIAGLSTRIDAAIESHGWKQYIEQTRTVLTSLKTHLEAFQTYCNNFSGLTEDYVCVYDHGWNPTYDQWTLDMRSKGGCGCKNAITPWDAGTGDYPIFLPPEVPCICADVCIGSGTYSILAEPVNYGSDMMATTSYCIEGGVFSEGLNDHGILPMTVPYVGWNYITQHDEIVVYMFKYKVKVTIRNSGTGCGMWQEIPGGPWSNAKEKWNYVSCMDCNTPTISYEVVQEELDDVGKRINEFSSYPYPARKEPTINLLADINTKLASLNSINDKSALKNLVTSVAGGGGLD